jgi:WD40 repeat protein
VLEGHDSIAWSIAFDPKQNALYSVGEDKRIIRWTRNEKNNKFEKTYSVGDIHAFPIYTCSLLTSDILVTVQLQ